MTEFACRVTDLAFCGSNTCFRFSITNSFFIDAKKSGDATVADLARSEPSDQVGALLAGRADLLRGEVVGAVCDPALHALGIAESDPDMAIEGPFRGMREIVLGFESVQELDLEIFGGLKSLLFGVIGLTRSKRMRCQLIILEVSGESGNRVGLDQVHVGAGIHDFGGDGRRVFLISGFIRCGGCGIIRH